MSGAELMFVVDRGACTGCQTCAVACLDRADLGDGAWLLAVRRKESGSFPNVHVSFGITHCWHCQTPSCLPVCPEGAISRAENGLISLDRGLCTGCGACVAACPYDAVLMLSDGLAAKCDGCPEQVAAGADPVCVRACPMRALAWGSADAFADRPRVMGAVDSWEANQPRVLYLHRAEAGKGGGRAHE